MSDYPKDKSKLFVGNLSSKVREDDLYPEFEKFGVVKSIKIKDKGGTNIFAFVEFENEKDAEEALNKLNKKVVMGQDMRIEFGHGGKPRHPGDQGGPKRCYVCDSPDHLARDCPEARSKHRRNDLYDKGRSRRSGSPRRKYSDSYDSRSRSRSKGRKDDKKSSRKDDKYYDKYDDRKRYDEKRYDDRKYVDRKYDDKRHDDRRYDDKRYDDRRYDDKRYDDRKYDDKRYDDHKYDDRKYSDKRYDDREQKHKDPKREDRKEYAREDRRVDRDKYDHSGRSAEKRKRSSPRAARASVSSRSYSR